MLSYSLYRWPLLSAGLLFAVLIIRNPWIVYKICYLRIFPSIIRGFWPFIRKKGFKKAKIVVPCYLRFWYLRDIFGTQPPQITRATCSLFPLHFMSSQQFPFAKKMTNPNCVYIKAVRNIFVRKSCFWMSV